MIPVDQRNEIGTRCNCRLHRLHRVPGEKGPLCCVGFFRSVFFCLGKPASSPRVEQLWPRRSPWHDHVDPVNCRARSVVSPQKRLLTSSRDPAVLVQPAQVATELSHRPQWSRRDIMDKPSDGIRSCAYATYTLIRASSTITGKTTMYAQQQFGSERQPLTPPPAQYLPAQPGLHLHRPVGDGRLGCGCGMMRRDGRHSVTRCLRTRLSGSAI